MSSFATNGWFHCFKRASIFFNLSWKKSLMKKIKANTDDDIIDSPVSMIVASVRMPRNFLVSIVNVINPLDISMRG